MEYFINLDVASRDVLRALLIQTREECETHKQRLDTYDSYCEVFEADNKRLQEELKVSQFALDEIKRVLGFEDDSHCFNF